MGNKITFDDALGQSKKPDTNRITFDEAIVSPSSMRTTSIPGTGRESKTIRGLMGDITIPAVPQLTEQRPYPAQDSNFGASLKSKLVEDPQTKRRLVAESLFPDDPNGINRVGIIDDRAVFVNDEGKLQYVSGDTANLGAAAVANSPEFLGAAAGSFAGSPVIGGALGAMGARGLKRAIAGVAFDEPQTVKGNLADVGFEGALNLAAGGAGKGIAKFTDRGKIIDFTPANVKTASQAREAIKNSTGIDVDLAQASGDRKLIAIRAYSARFPGKSSELVQAADEITEGQLDTAVGRVMDLVANATPAETAGMQGVNAAQMAIKMAREKVYSQVRPLYDAAYDSVPEVTDEKILSMLDLPHFQRAFANGRRLAKLEGHVVDEVPSLRALDYTKRALDDRIDALSSSGKRQEARALKIRRNEFVEALDALPDQKWQLARKQYGELIRATVEPLEQGPVGVLARIEKPRLATAAAKILDDENVTPALVNRTRVALSQQDPEAWNGLVRQWMTQKWNKALSETQTGAAVNPAGKLRQSLIGTPVKKAKIAAMLEPKAAQAFDDLMTAAQALSRTPISGSNTMRDTEIRDQFKGQGAVVFRWLTSPFKAVQGAAEQRALEKNTLAVTEAILNPAKQAQLRQIVRMKPSTQQAMLLVSILGGQAAQQNAAPGVTEIPSQSTQQLR